MPVIGQNVASGESFGAIGWSFVYLLNHENDPFFENWTTRKDEIHSFFYFLLKNKL
jgi:hypothetical protein